MCIRDRQRTVTSRGFDSVYADLHQTLKEKKIIPVGPPLAIFLDEEYHPEALRVNLALPVAGTPAGSQLLQMCIRDRKSIIK